MLYLSYKMKKSHTDYLYETKICFLICELPVSIFQLGVQVITLFVLIRRKNRTDK